VAGTSQMSQFVWSKVNGPHSTATPAHARPAAPDFTLTDAAGQPVRLSDFRGQVVLLNFWATWCPPCRVEIPWFDRFQQQYGGRGLAVLGLSVDEDGWKSVRPFLAANKVSYRILAEGGGVAELFGGVDTLPSTLTIDRQGRIAAVHSGLIGKESYRASIEAMLAE
jgi:peroxiredoxin